MEQANHADTQQEESRRFGVAEDDQALAELPSP